MLTSYKYEAKTKEEAYNKCELEFNKDDVFIKEKEIQIGLFKQKRYQLIVVSKNDIKTYIKTYIKKIDETLKINIISEISEKDNIININLTSEKNPILIGKDGKTLDAIQNLIRNSIKNKVNMDIKINIDASSYKKTKENHFEKEIRRIIEDVLKTHVEAKLDPMNSYKRRLVHNIATNYENIKTESIGEEPFRYTLIRYKED